MDIGDRVFLKRRFYDEADKEDTFGVIVEKVWFGTIALFMVKWDKLPVPLQYTEHNLIPAILHEKYKSEVARIVGQGDKHVHHGHPNQSGHQ
jgi:hypothetical protein